MARQTACLAKRFTIAPNDLRLVTCGGAWKAHPLMFEAFRAELAASNPQIITRLHRFEHIMAGPARIMLDQTPGQAAIDGLEKRLMDLFPDFVNHYENFIS